MLPHRPKWSCSSPSEHVSNIRMMLMMILLMMMIMVVRGEGQSPYPPPPPSSSSTSASSRSNNSRRNYSPLPSSRQPPPLPAASSLFSNARTYSDRVDSTATVIRTYTDDEEYDDRTRPPPPPPPPLLQHVPPIHYSFPQRQTTTTTNNNNNNDTNQIQFDTDLNQYPDDIPIPNNNPSDISTTGGGVLVQQQPPQYVPQYATARNDRMTQYISQSRLHRVYLSGSAALVGCTMTAFLGQSILGHAVSSSILLVVAVWFAIGIWIRNNIYGELVRAISLALILSIQRYHQIRSQYPAGQYCVRAILGDDQDDPNHRRRGWRRRQRRQRQPFPPTNNPWTWSNRVITEEEKDDHLHPYVEFQMLPTVMAMAVVGAIMGSTSMKAVLPIVPTSLCALTGAIALAYTTTLASSKGDLCRCMGMRMVLWVRELIQISTELHLPEQTSVVASHVLDRILILDRQHNIRRRIIDGCHTFMKTVSRIQQDMQQQPPRPSQQQQQQQQRRRPVASAFSPSNRATVDRNKHPRPKQRPSPPPPLSARINHGNENWYNDDDDDVNYTNLDDDPDDNYNRPVSSSSSSSQKNETTTKKKSGWFSFR
jgi:hypothetical protein